ncbi:hypothetical protein GDO78_015404 [Eleutherodactylus coqui]|uniref:DBB domain-containing protein n=1 Tax=Eleutherodactylus coqui TaxID=57060 RepID=A0A8J6JP59_ELECQ|nr:hypothetical protein GDO78_015404 [Eleutherodactylus coqui]
MASRGMCDLLILHGPDAIEWCGYLVSLFGTNHQLQPLSIETYELCEDSPIPKKSIKTFQTCRCILLLLSGDLESTFENPEVLENLRNVLKPPNKVIVLLCGVIDKEDFTTFFEDWPKWKTLSSEDDPELYVTTLMDTISIDSGCGSVSDTDVESDKEQLPVRLITGNLLTIQPERIHCGVKTQIYLIFKCKLDSRVKNEVCFIPLSGPSTRLPSTLQNQYMLSVDAPDLPSGPVFLRVFSGDLLICEAKITYFTDMEEICNLLDNATNPIEFMCQAFKIMPYDKDVLDKTLTESLKSNIPASGLHLFGINQIEEENFSASEGETADMLRSHIKEELMNDNEDESIYEPMANLSTDLLMKYTLQPDMELYLPMKGRVSPHDSEETYTEMLHIKDDYPSSEKQSSHDKDSALRRILEGSTYGDDDDDYSEGKGIYDTCIRESFYDIVCEGKLHSAAISRPPVPVPRPQQLPDAEPYIAQWPDIHLRRDRQQSSVYDPFVGMKTPGQRELITLQERVKLGMISVDEAVLEFKEWQLNHKKRSDSLRYQQENLKKLRDSINRRLYENKKQRKSTDLEITKPIRRGQNLEVKQEFAIYDSSACLLPPKREIKRGNWKTDSTSSTTSRYPVTVYHTVSLKDATAMACLSSADNVVKMIGNVSFYSATYPAYWENYTCLD